MHLNANQAHRPVSSQSRLSSPPDTRAPQPVQHSSAFIFISRGTASCHSLGKSTPKISSFVCTALTQEVLLKVYHLYCLGRATLQHSHTPVSFGSFNIKGFKCQMLTSIIQRRRINSLKTFYPQGDGWLLVVYQPRLGSAGGGKAVVFHLLHRVLSLFLLFFSLHFHGCNCGMRWYFELGLFSSALSNYICP